jgi:DNA-binding response OmpR family regulator
VTAREGRILLVEDDPDIVEVVRTYLGGAGYRVEVASDGRSGLSAALHTPPKLIVLDLMLPGLDGLEFLRRLRATHDTPVIMLTARAEEADRVVGLELGADDYVTKPFSPRELLARVRAVLRRSEDEAEPRDAPVVYGELRIEPAARRVTVGGEEIELTAREFDLLELLARNPGRVFRRGEILDRVWGHDFVGVDRVVDVHVSNIRRKLAAYPDLADAITTLRTVGYKLRDEA